MVSRFACALAGLGLAAVLLGAQSPAPPPGFAAKHLPEGPAKPLVARACTDCHTLDRVVRAHQARADWEETVGEMVDKGADLADSDLPGLLDYLVANFGPDSPYIAAPDGSVKLNLNLANAAQLQAMLEITADQAQALVAWRTAHGPVHDAGELSAVPGLDAGLAPGALAAWTSRLTF